MCRTLQITGVPILWESVEFCGGGFRVVLLIVHQQWPSKDGRTARTLLLLLEIHNKYTATNMHGADVLASHIVAQWGRWEGVQRK